MNMDAVNRDDARLHQFGLAHSRNTEVNSTQPLVMAPKEHSSEAVG
jgi:hypothetical protein